MGDEVSRRASSEARFKVKAPRFGFDMEMPDIYLLHLPFVLLLEPIKPVRDK